MGGVGCISHTKQYGDGYGIGTGDPWASAGFPGDIVRNPDGRHGAERAPARGANHTARRHVLRPESRAVITGSEEIHDNEVRKSWPSRPLDRGNGDASSSHVLGNIGRIADGREYGGGGRSVIRTGNRTTEGDEVIQSEITVNWIFEEFNSFILNNLTKL